MKTGGSSRARSAVLLAAGFCVLLFLSLYLQNSGGSSQPEYTVFSTGEGGLSLLYDTLERAGCPVKTEYLPIDAGTGGADIRVVTQPLPSYADEAAQNDMLDWVYGGGSLIFLETPFPTLLDDYFYDDIDGYMYDYEYNGFYIYEYGDGYLVTADAARFVNSALMAGDPDGASLMEILDSLGGAGVEVRFNEYYHGFDYGGNAWQQAPAVVKVIVVQAAAAAVLLVLRLGKRFGRPVPYYEDREREENEYVLALAAVYEKAKVT
ncbi:MAG: hypothetical protein FWC55_00995 [Firmicutes bacterium]|nr:hypothetical protein [Bacillota bacterium]